MANGFDEILRGVSIKRSRSPLEPYRPLVEELHRRGLSLREIAGVLAQRCNVQTSHVAIHKLLQHKYPRPFDLTRQRSTCHVEAGKSVKMEPQVPPPSTSISTLTSHWSWAQTTAASRKFVKPGAPAHMVILLVGFIAKFIFKPYPQSRTNMVCAMRPDLGAIRSLRYMFIKRILVLLAAAITLTMGALADDKPSDQTFGLSNGRYWNSVGADFRKIYVIGLSDGWHLRADTEDLMKGEAIYAFSAPGGFHASELATMITAAYAETENTALPIGWVALASLAVQRGEADKNIVFSALRKFMATLQGTKGGRKNTDFDPLPTIIASGRPWLKYWHRLPEALSALSGRHALKETSPKEHLSYETNTENRADLTRLMIRANAQTVNKPVKTLRDVEIGMSRETVVAGLADSYLLIGAEAHQPCWIVNAKNDPAWPVNSGTICFSTTGRVEQSPLRS
jgi:hypothetical protein